VSTQGRRFGRGGYLKLPPAWGWDRDWMLRAACGPATAELFFPDGNGRSTEAEALAVCAECPVVRECRDLADRLERRSTSPSLVHGVWGGEAPVGRIRRRRAENRGEAAQF
jgi:WhiB family redox-sensing transcriptional regulator